MLRDSDEYEAAAATNNKEVGATASLLLVKDGEECMDSLFDLDPLSSASLDDYRSAQAVMEQFGTDAEHRMLERVDQLYMVGDQREVSRYMNVLVAIHKLRRMLPMQAAVH